MEGNTNQPRVFLNKGIFLVVKLPIRKFKTTTRHSTYAVNHCDVLRQWPKALEPGIGGGGGVGKAFFEDSNARFALSDTSTNYHSFTIELS
jgi:hypothetical protein